MGQGLHSGKHNLQHLKWQWQPGLRCAVSLLWVVSTLLCRKALLTLASLWLGTVPAGCRRVEGGISTGLQVKPCCLHLHLDSIVTNISCVNAASLVLFLESECKQKVFLWDGLTVLRVSSSTQLENHIPSGRSWGKLWAHIPMRFE